MATIRTHISEHFPSIVPRQGNEPGNEVAHLLWMCTEINQTMSPKKIIDALKAARWVGWMLHECEVLGFWDNEKSRELARADVEAKNDLPR